jgi:hypothetical protein
VGVGQVLFENESDDVELNVDWEDCVPEAIHCYQLAVKVVLLYIFL